MKLTHFGCKCWFNARQWLKDHPDVQQELLDKIMARSSGIAEEMTTGPSDDDVGDVAE